MILEFDLEKLPTMDCMEQQWSDAILKALRLSDPKYLPDGVAVASQPDDDDDDEPAGWRTKLASESD